MLSVFSIWHVSLHAHTKAHMPLVWCIEKIACTSNVYNTFCLEHWNKENKRKNKSIKFINWCLIVILTFVNLLLTWMLYFHVWLQNKGKFIVSSEYYNQFDIY